MTTSNIREEEVKNRLRQDFFQDYDATPILGDIDFAVTTPCTDKAQTELFDREYFLWAEAKAGTSHDIIESFIQLIITIGKAHTHERMLPPRYLGAFDEEKIAFLEFHHIVPVFYQNDFNWNVAPSNHDTKEFRQLYGMLRDLLQKEISLFRLKQDEKPLRRFISQNFRLGRQRTTGVSITKNNYPFVFQRWVEEVKPTIDINWNDVPPTRVVDFFYADLISRNDYTLREELAVVLRGDRYKVLSDIIMGSTQLFSEARFNDGMAAYRQFWNKYQRPPRKEYLDIILMRRDLLIPQDLRKYKGAFFTPPQWVQKSQEYLAAELGDDWQQQYYVWDCCAGTGNLLFGLTEPYRIYASTLDNADVQVMRERIKEKSLNLLDTHVFQFDFLNDPFTRLPRTLQDIINDPEKRKRLVIYINPPYAEAGEIKQLNGTSQNKKDVAVKTKAYERYLSQIGIAGRELFAQFIMRIYTEIPQSKLAIFCKLKNLQAPNFQAFRQVVKAAPSRIFLVPASSFDNVKGRFPISFSLFDFAKEQAFDSVEADVFDAKGENIGKKTICSYDNTKGVIGSWVLAHKDEIGKRIGFMSNGRNDFQNQKLVYLINRKEQMPTPRGWWVTPNNLIIISIFLAVRHCVEATWLNDRDQFLWPNDGWKADKEFQSDCLAYTLFSNANNIKSTEGVNHWLPFTEAEVGARDVFESHFMHDYITGKHQPKEKAQPVEQSLFDKPLPLPLPSREGSDMLQGANGKVTTPLPTGEGQGGEAAGALVFSPEATTVMDAARELWCYYHQQPGANPNASYYDIRGHFQGFTSDKKGKQKMNADSTDEQYNRLVKALRQAVRTLAQKIEPKVYEYGFLKQ